MRYTLHMLSLNLIVRAVICHEGRFLVTAVDEGERELFYTFLGGHVHMGETLTQSMQREVSEEIGLSVSVVKLLYIVENFFFRGAAKLHEIGYYFLCHPQRPVSGSLLETLSPNREEHILPTLMTPAQLHEANFQPELIKQTLCEDARENFAGCPRAVIINELPADVDALSGVSRL